MEITLAADKLLEHLHAPSWAVSVAAVDDDNGARLIVRIDQNFRSRIDVPHTFHGYSVVSELRGQNFALHA